MTANAPAQAESELPDTPNRVFLHGDTFPVKETLKQKYGAKWEKSRKAWSVSDAVASEAQEFVDQASAPLREEAARRRLAEEEQARLQREASARQAAEVAERRAAVTARFREMMESAHWVVFTDAKAVDGVGGRRPTVTYTLDGEVRIDITGNCPIKAVRASRRVTEYVVKIPILKEGITKISYWRNTDRAASFDIDDIEVEEDQKTAGPMTLDGAATA